MIGSQGKKHFNVISVPHLLFVVSGGLLVSHCSALVVTYLKDMDFVPWALHKQKVHINYSGEIFSLTKLSLDVLAQPYSYTDFLHPFSLEVSVY